MTIDLLGTPKYILNSDTGIIVISTKDSRYYSKVFSKADLQL